jgi:toxin ParE1/3/4
MNKITFRKEAEKDIEEIYEWYESKRDGLGEEFLGSIDEVLSKLSFNSKIYPLVFKNIRRAFVKRFPFGVFYSEKENSILVFAVMHARRSLANWTKRI